MFKLDNNFLSSMGLGSLPVHEKNRLLQTIYERLEMNVGMRLAEGMSEAQMREFEGFIDQKDEEGALRWLEFNFPDYKVVVKEELDKLRSEVMQAAPHIIAASQQSPIAPVAGVDPGEGGAVNNVSPPQSTANSMNDLSSKQTESTLNNASSSNGVMYSDSGLPQHQPPPGPGNL